MPAYPRVPVYLFYGTQTDTIMRARDQLLADYLPAEFRDQNLTEHLPTTSSNTIKLADLLDEIAGDLETLSFIEEAPRAIVVMNPAEVFSGTPGRGGKGKGKKAGADERIAHWIESRLPKAGGFLVLLALEDESAGREVNERQPGAVFKAIQKVGLTRGWRGTKAMFRIEDALLGRDLDGLLRAVRELWKPGKGDSTVWSQVVRSLRFQLEAAAARDPRFRNDPGALEKLFPEEAQRNVLKAHPAVKSKYVGRASYRTADLLEAYRAMMDVYRALRPRPGDYYVPDAQGLMEQALVRLLTSRPPGR